MDRQKQIEILMQDSCTEFDAEKHLKNGTTIYAESEKADYIANCIGCLMDEDEAVAEWDRLPKVNHDGKAYRIAYVL